MADEVYTHGHHESVLRSHTWRNAENSARYLLPELRPGGLLAARDSDYACVAWAPPDPLLARWLELYRAVARRNEGEPDAGRFLKSWALKAGFHDVRATSSTWTYADPQSCAWWGNLWADRCELSSLGEQAVSYGLSTREELGAVAAAFRAWSKQPEAFFMVPHGEILARPV